MTKFVAFVLVSFFASSCKSACTFPESCDAPGKQKLAQVLEQEDQASDPNNVQLLQLAGKLKQAVSAQTPEDKSSEKMVTTPKATAKDPELMQNVITHPDERCENDDSCELLPVKEKSIPDSSPNLLSVNASIPDEKNEDNAHALLSVNASIGTSDCPSQPQGWHGCAYGGLISVPAFCASSNRITLNSGTPLNFLGCAFLTAQSSACSDYFYTQSTSGNTGGVCKCCKAYGPFYASSSCNWIYKASSSCAIR